MRVVAGADEAGEGPQAADGTQRTAKQAEVAGPTAGQITGNAQPSTSTTEQPVDQAQQGSGQEAGLDGEQAPQEPEPASQTPGFGERGRMRRRARFLRKARELAYRDLGGLVFDLHRFGQRNDPLVLAKLATLSQIDTEVRELEVVLRERRPVTVLREVGIAACPRCAAIHDSDDRFCPGCGLAFDANADRPISSAPVSPSMQTPTPAPVAPTGAQGPVRTAPQTPVQSTPQAPTRTVPQPVQRPAAPTTMPVRPPDSATGEDEPTQILRPPAKGT